MKINSRYIINNYNNLDVHMNKSTNKLSSGMRITRASNDVAGLSISERMRSG